VPVGQRWRFSRKRFAVEPRACRTHRTHADRCDPARSGSRCVAWWHRRPAPGAYDVSSSSKSWDKSATLTHSESKDGRGVRCRPSDPW
jgi:hypothetical protein